MSSAASGGRRITISSISCRGVRAFVPFQKPPLYAAVSLGGRRDKTPPDPDGGENPDWDDAAFAFDLDAGGDGGDQLVEFEVKAQVPLLGNKLVGTASVPVVDLAAPGAAGAVLRHVSYQVSAPDGTPNGTLRFAYAVTGGPGVLPPQPQFYPSAPDQNHPSFCCEPPTSAAAYPAPPPPASFAPQSGAGGYPPPPQPPSPPAASAPLYPSLQDLLLPSSYPPPPTPPNPNSSSYPPPATAAVTAYPPPPPAASCTACPAPPAEYTSYPPPPAAAYPPPPPPASCAACPAPPSQYASYPPPSTAYPPAPPSGYPTPPASNSTPPASTYPPPPPESGSAYPVYPRSAPSTVDRGLPYYPAPPGGGGSYYPPPGTRYPELGGAAGTPPHYYPPPGSRYP